MRVAGDVGSGPVDVDVGADWFILRIIRTLSKFILTVNNQAKAIRFCAEELLAGPPSPNSQEIRAIRVSPSPLQGSGMGGVLVIMEFEN